MVDINVNKLSEALNGKADIDLNNTGVFSTTGGGVNLTLSTPSGAESKEVVSADYVLNKAEAVSTNCVVTPSVRNSLRNITQNFNWSDTEAHCCVPNGFTDADDRKFTFISGINNTVFSPEANTSYYFLLNELTGQSFPCKVDNFVISETEPSHPTNENNFWFDLTTNKIKYYYGNNQRQESSYVLSLPFCMVTVDSTGANVSDIILFDGLFYHKGYLSIYEGLKYRVPYGLKGHDRNNYYDDFITTSGGYRNLETSLKSTSFEFLGDVYTGQVEEIFLDAEGNRVSIDCSHYFETTSYPGTPSSGIWFNPKQNAHYQFKTVNGTNMWWQVELFHFASMQIDTSGIVRKLNIKMPFQALDQSDAPRISGWALPSSKYVNMSVGASGTEYIAPTNGWFFCVTQGNTSYLYIINKTLTDAGAGHAECANLAGGYYRVTLPARKGDRIQIYYDGSLTLSSISFHYSEGEV